MVTGQVLSMGDEIEVLQSIPAGLSFAQRQIELTKLDFGHPALCSSALHGFVR